MKYDAIEEMMKHEQEINLHYKKINKKLSALFRCLSSPSVSRKMKVNIRKQIRKITKDLD